MGRGTPDKNEKPATAALRGSQGINTHRSVPPTSAFRRKLARSYWGEPDETIALGDGVSWYSTPSHGGVIGYLPPTPDTDAWRALLDHIEEEDFLAIHADRQGHRFIVGEEDEEWAKALLILQASGATLHTERVFGPGKDYETMARAAVDEKTLGLIDAAASSTD